MPIFTTILILWLKLLDNLLLKTLLWGGEIPPLYLIQINLTIRRLLAITVLWVHGGATLEGDGVVVLVGPAGEDDVGVQPVAVQAVHREVGSRLRTLAHRAEQQLRLAQGHGVDRASRWLFTLQEFTGYRGFE